MEEMIIMTLNEFQETCQAKDIAHNEIEDVSRWDIHYLVVIKKEDYLTGETRFYRGSYRIGATESQDTDYKQEIEFKRVWPVQKMVTVYERTPPV